MVVLVTGGTGFIGQRLVSRLKESGAILRLLSRQKLKLYDTVICDLEKDSVPDDALIGVDMVFHLAGFAHDFLNAARVEHIYKKVNVDATVDLAKLAVQKKIKKFVYVSSVKAGGSAIAGQCMTENNHGKPEGIYGDTKKEAEQKLLEIGLKSSLRISIVRPSLVYGPGVKGNLHLMLSGIEKGWFPPLPETGNRRSMIHVDDLVQALLLVAGDNRANGEIFIATDGVPHSSREIYEAMCHVVGKSIPRWNVPKFIFDIASLIHPRLRYKIDKLLGNEYYSSEKLQSLGFRPLRNLNDWSDY